MIHNSQMLSSGSTQTSSLRPLLASKVSKKVSFFRSGDPQFSGHRVVINSRTFRTFDALLDDLSKKVPVPFGVRTITTPRGTRTIRSLDDLRHGGSYVCSDRRKVKALNLDEINRRHVPWNSTGPTSAGVQGRRGLIRQLVQKHEAGRKAKIAARTPKRLVVFKNRDPGTKHMVVLQRTTARTFEAVLEHLSQVMQFPVVKLYTADGRRVEGLPALTLCPGAVVAAGDEPFQPANFNPRASSSHSQPSHVAMSESTASTKTQPAPASRRPRSRNFPLSSERYFVDRINVSLKRSYSDENEVEIGSIQSTNNQALEWEETDKRQFMSVVEENDQLIMPSDDQVEKSFCVNQDGSMTVEMKVRLTMKQEEMIHWTTTVSRACVNSQETAACSQPASSYDSPDKKDNKSRTKESNIDVYESKEKNTQHCRPIKLNKDRANHWGCANSEAFPNPKCLRRPTPGPRRARRKTSPNRKSRAQTKVQETRVGTCLHLENTTEGELSEESCVVSRSSSGSTRPVPNPGQKYLEAAKHNETHSSLSGMSEVLQLHNKEKKITETVIPPHHHSQDTCQNQLARTWTENDRFEFMSRKPGAGSHSSSNDCDTYLTKFLVRSGSRSSRNNEDLSSVSGQSEPSQTKSTLTVYKNQARCEFLDTRVKTSTKEGTENKIVKKMAQRSERSNKHRTEKKQKGNVSNFLKKREGQSPEKVKMSHSDMLMDPPQNINSGCTDRLKPHMEDKTDVIQTSHSTPSKIQARQSLVNSSITKSPKKCKELSESVSMPALLSSPSKVQRYVENWLETNHPDSVSYTGESKSHKSTARFQIESEFSDISEIKSESDKDNVDKKSVSRQLVQIRCEGQPAATQNLRRFSKSLPSVKMHINKQQISRRKDKSLDDLVLKIWPDAGSDTSPNTQSNPRSATKQVLERLCSPPKCSRRACSHSCQSSMKLKKKSRSLPDCSLHLASVLGYSSKTLLSFLIMMTLRYGTAISANAGNSGSNPETLHVMQSLQKLASIKDEEELKASLLGLQSLVSAELKKNWRESQEKNDVKENPRLSPRQLEQDFAPEVNSEKGNQDQGHTFYIKESSLHDKGNTTALLGKEPDIEELDRVQIKKTTSQKGRPEIVDDVKTNQEKYINEESKKADLCENKQEMKDNVQMVDEKYTKHEINQADEIYVPDYSLTNLENKVGCQKDVGRMQSESELLIPTTTNSEVIRDTSSETEDCPDSFGGCGKKLKKGVNNSEGTNHAEEPDLISVDLETETEEAPCSNKGTTGTEKKTARSEASGLSADEADPYGDSDHGPMEVENNADNEEPISSTSDCENPAAKPHRSLMTDQTDKQTDSESVSRTWQEFKTQNKFQKSGEKSVTMRQAYNSNENDVEVDEEEDFDADPNSPLHLHQEDEYSDQSKPSNSQGTLAELDLQPLDEENVSRSSIHLAEKKESGTHKPRRTTEKANMDDGCHCGHPLVLPQQLLDFVNLALMSSALIFTYDSNGFLRLEPDRCKSGRMSLSKSSVDNPRASSCLHSPNTSDLSDYRPDTSDSGREPSQVSTDLFTESGEDEAGRTFVYQGNVKRSSENINRKVQPLDNVSKRTFPNAKQLASPVYCNSSGSNGKTKLAQHLAFHTNTDSEEGVLIDKGRWLLKENHLIRKSPPVPMGMYDDLDTTSVDTGHTSDDAPCIPCGTQQSRPAVISSSELEDITKPSTPKCTYFNMVHSSDSDPFLDNQSLSSNRGKGFTRKSKEVSPVGEPARMRAKKNGSLPSFSSVEFKPAAGKVHPADSPASSAVGETDKSQNLRCNTRHEEESVEGLSLPCGQHCSIL